MYFQRFMMWDDYDDSTPENDHQVEAFPDFKIEAGGTLSVYQVPKAMCWPPDKTTRDDWICPEATSSEKFKCLLVFGQRFRRSQKGFHV